MSASTNGFGSRSTATPSHASLSRSDETPDLMQPVTRRTVPRSLDPKRTDRWVLGFWILNLAVFLHVVVFETPLWLTYAYNGLLYCVGGVLASYSRRVRTPFVLGTVAGVVELVADSFLVDFTGTLVYPDGLPTLLHSPLYMPLAWAIVITQLGYVGIRLSETYGRRVAAVVPALTAATLVGFYEYGAFYAGIWEYVGAPLLLVGHVPLYVVVAEGIMFACLHEFVRLDRPVVAGVGFGLLVGASYSGTYFAFAALAG